MRPTPFLLLSLAASKTSSRLLYEHGYHAGNYADVVKHSVLIRLLEHMRIKASPFCYIETHSGAGAYPLSSSESLRLGEHERGISLLLSKRAKATKTTTPLPPSAETLLGIMDRVSNNNDDNQTYPGSPIVAASLCRDIDSLLLCENAPDQFERLQEHLDGVDSATLLLDNGYKALKRSENIQSNKRALIFVDPPYQLGSDTEQTAALVSSLQKHWRSARIAIWHPVSKENRFKSDRLYEQIRKASGRSDCLATELCGGENDVGSGMLLINPPYGIDEELRELLPELGRLLGNEENVERAEQPEVRVEWL